MLVTLEEEDRQAQLGGAQAGDEAGDVVSVFTQDVLIVPSLQLFSSRGSLHWSTSGTSGFIW